MPPGGRHDKEASLSPDPDIDTEDAALPHNLQDMFSIGHNYREDSGMLTSYESSYANILFCSLTRNLCN